MLSTQTVHMHGYDVFYAGGGAVRFESVYFFRAVWFPEAPSPPGFSSSRPSAGTLVAEQII